MNKKFDWAVEAVKAHLEEHQYSYSIIMGHLRCYRLLCKYLTDNKKPYNKESASEWLEELTAAGFCRSTANTYRGALEKLDAVYHNRALCDARERYDARYDYWQLPSWCSIVFETFITELPDSYSGQYIQSIKVATARFLKYCADRGVCRAENITHRLVVNYDRDDQHGSYKAKDVYNDYVRKFLRFLADKGVIMASIPLMLDKFTLSRLVFIDDLADDDAFHACVGASFLCAETYYKLALEMDTLIERQRYSKSVKKEFRKVFKELFVFLEANSLGYSINTALMWADYMRRFTVQWKSFRRAVMLFEQFRGDGCIDPQKVYNYQVDRTDTLPEWFKTDYDAFIATKAKAGFAPSTLAMYRSSCLRFFEYLNTVGIVSWEDVTPKVLKEFHIQDSHSTPEGKNAYASKIRIFLEYLGDIGRLSPSLFSTMPSEFAGRVDIVRVLSDTDVTRIYDYKNNADSAFELRDAAMVFIGMRMGVRASDIIKLTFSDVSWEKKTLSIKQQKTGKYLRLPMPVEVGNAIYRYITEGRPKADSEFIFISHRVPYNKLARPVCQKALLHALPECSHGFHITRKTFASRMLFNNVAPGRIAEALGHVDQSSVMTYLATNQEKMRQCALSLDCIPVRGGVLS